MENLGKHHAYSDTDPSVSAAHEEYAVPEVIITHRLRDRKMLQKRKAEAEDKELIQWVPRKQKRSKHQKRSRGGRQGKSCQTVVDFSLQPEPETKLQPEFQEDAKPVSSEFGEPVQTIQDLAAGEEEVLKPTEEETPKSLTVPPETDFQDD